MLRNIKEIFTDLQTQVKLKLLLSFFHIPRRLIDEVSWFYFVGLLFHFHITSARNLPRTGCASLTWSSIKKSLQNPSNIIPQNISSYHSINHKENFFILYRDRDQLNPKKKTRINQRWAFLNDDLLSIEICGWKGLGTKVKLNSISHAWMRGISGVWHAKNVSL